MKNWLQKRKIKPKPKLKKVKAWAILGIKDSIAAVMVQKNRPERYYIGSWGGFVTPEDKVVQCEITYKI